MVLMFYTFDTFYVFICLSVCLSACLHPIVDHKDTERERERERDTSGPKIISGQEQTRNRVISYNHLLASAPLSNKSRYLEAISILCVGLKCLFLFAKCILLKEL